MESLTVNRKRRRASLVVAGLAALIVMTAGSIKPANAQDQPAPEDSNEPEGFVQVVEHSASVASDGELTVTLDWTGPVEGHFLSILFHQKVDSEGDVSGPVTTVLNRRDSVPLATIPTDADGNLVATIPVRSVSPAPNDRVYLPAAGVYPFTAEIRTSEGPVASVTSAVVRLPQDPTEMATVDVTVVLALSPADGLDLSDALWFLTSYPEVPFTLQLDEAVLTQLERDSVLAAQFAAAAEGRPVMSDAGVDLDPSALEEIGQGRFYLEAMEATHERLRRLGLSPSTDIVMLSPRLTGDGAALLARSGVVAVMSTRHREIDIGSITTPDGRIQLIGPDRALTTELAAAPGSFAAPDIYELYARLTIRAEQDPTSVILGGEGAPQLDSQSLDTLLPALLEGGPVRVVSLDAALATQPRNPLLAAERPEQDLVASGEAIAELQQLADTSRSFRGVQNPILEQLLVDSLSRSRNPVDRTRAIERAKAELLSDLGSISLPASQSLTLTAVEGPLPLTIRNRAASSRLVLLEFIGDRVAVAEDGETLTIPPGETTLELTAEARALGVSTVEVIARTPDGTRVLATTRYQIRSTAVPGLGWAISGTALLFLLLWWFRNSRSSRPRAPHLTGVARPRSPTTEPDDPPGLAAEVADTLRSREAM